MALFTTPGASLGGVPGSTALARLLVVISGNTAGLTGALNQATGSLSGFQSNAGALGNTLTRSLTLPILAIGGAAIKTALDFESAMARVAGLSGVTADQVAGLTEEILEMSASDAVAAGPTELADSLYFAASAGLSVSQAMDVVKVSAQGMSIGMGSASDISRVLIASLNAFEQDGLTAAQAMDSLAAAVKIGAAEPNELAVALGRLLPVAAEVGVTFQDTVASIAALTNIGIPTKVATTGMRALLSQLLAPTEKASDNLHALGVGYNELSDALANGGPLAAFALLEDATEGNAQALHNIIPQIRGFTSYLGLTGEKADDYNRALEATRNSTGTLDRALAEFADTGAYRFQNAMDDLQVAAIKVGAVVLPVFKNLINALGDVGEAVAAIPTPVLAVVSAFLGLLALAGPALKLFSALNTANGVFVGGLKQTGTAAATAAVGIGLAVGSLSSLAAGTGGIVSAITGATGAFVALVSIMGIVRNAARTLAIQNIVLGQSFSDSAIRRFATALSGLSGAALAGIAGALTAVAVGVALYIRNANLAEKATEDLAAGLTNAAASGQTFNQFLSTLDIGEGPAQQLYNIAKQAGVLGKSVGESFKQLNNFAGDALAQNFRDLANGVEEANPELAQQARIAADAADNNESWGAALSKAGVDIDDFADAADNAGRSLALVDEATYGNLENIHNLEVAYNAAATASADYQLQQDAIIASHLASEESIANLAREWGVSQDFIQSGLDDTGLSAVGLSESNKKLLAENLKIINQNGAFVGALAEQRAAEQELISSRQENIRSAIDFFGGLEDISKASSSKIIEEIQKITQAQVDFASNTKTLAARGLDPAALQFLVDEGPQAVAAFVDMSDKELARWENNFAIAMAAGDAVVLNEGKHLEGKGNTMISNFAEAILSNKDITGQAAHQIMGEVQDALNSGKLKDSGLKGILAFAEGITLAKDIPPGKVAPIVNALVAKLSDDPKFFESGEGNIRQWAAGIAANAGLPKSAVGQIINATIRAIHESQPKYAGAARIAALGFVRGITTSNAEAAGAGRGLAQAALNAASGVSLRGVGAAMGNSLASGIRSAIGNVIGAAVDAVNAAKRAAEDAAHNSPEYFTYYMGQKFMADMQRGIDSQKTPFIGRPTTSIGQGGRGANGGGGPLRIEGVLDTPFGPAKMRGIVRDEIYSGDHVDKALARAGARRRNR